MSIKKSRLFLAIPIIGILLVSVFIGREYAELRQPGIIVLLYHRIGDGQKGKYYMDAQRFKEQMNYLKIKGYETILPNELDSLKSPEKLRKEVILSFDDGTKDHYLTVYPILISNGQRGVFFVISKFVNLPGQMSEDEIRKMSQGGMEIGSHSYSHAILDQLDRQRIVLELSKSKSDLERMTGDRIVSFATPGGWYNDGVVEAARDAGYKFFFGCRIGRTDPGKNPFIYKRIEVLGDTSLREFDRILNPPEILFYRISQSIKFLIHGLVGSENYQRIRLLLNPA